MALEMPLDADSCCAYFGVEGRHKVYRLRIVMELRYYDVIKY